MIKRIITFLFSMQLMAVLMILFAASVAFATFIENDFGTSAARAVVYDAFWFEMVMALLAVNFIGNVSKYKMLKRKKLTIFLFHIAFIVIILGAFVTRYVGQEGIMHIREGKVSNQILSSESYLKIDVLAKEGMYRYSENVQFSSLTPHRFSKKIKVEGDVVQVKSIGFIPNAVANIVASEQGQDILELIVPGNGGRQSVFVPPGGDANIYGYSVSYSSDTSLADINIFKSGDELNLYAKIDIGITDKRNWSDTVLIKNNVHKFKNKTLYKLEGKIFVLKDLHPSSDVLYIENPDKEAPKSADLIQLELSSDDEVKTLNIWSNSGSIGKGEEVLIDGKKLIVSYGSKIVDLPFSLKLNDFILDRYPGSNSPSSFKSKVVLIDQQKGINEPREIFMNNVLKHRGYKFYQSSYDTDELGTVLSVNKDLPGSFITYFGYILLAIGMLLSLANKNSRFQSLRRNSSLAVILLLFLIPGIANASDKTWEDDLSNYTIDEDHAASFGALMVQDNNGRIKPVNTLGSQVLRKVSRKQNLNGLNSDQVFLSMLVYPEYWQKVPLIKVSNDGVKDLLGMEGKYISFSELTFNNNTGSYILAPYVEEAYRKKPAYRSKFDNEIIKIDERVNICYIVFVNSMLKIFPSPEDDPSQKWYTPADSVSVYQGNDTINVSYLIRLYYQEIDNSLKSNNWKQADEYLGYLKVYQDKFGGEIMPSDNKQKLELWYNKSNIFDRISNYYALFGFIILILNFVALISQKFKVKLINRIGLVFILLIFLSHAAGLAMRWYVAGHAPWSNGYEALIYIAWATVLSGIIFSRNAPITLPLTAVLAFLILHVAHLSWMDPEITTLVPVLKSVWLVIHVAIITASYGFLALAALLGLVNLFLMVFKAPANSQRIDLNISKLSGIMEMTLISGLYMLAIGTFLGGVWANESWGRYWAWDPKEAWALITCIVYAFIAHMRLIPGLKGYYTFNVFAVFGFSSVIMTYFGVNYYLAGLHSYAKGDPLPVPSFVIYTIVTLVVLSLIAYFNTKRIEKKV